MGLGKSGKETGLWGINLVRRNSSFFNRSLNALLLLDDQVQLLAKCFACSLN